LAVLKIYIVPYLNVNLWLVLITKLHHTDKELPHYRNDEWNWLRGQLSTKDRTYGYVIDTILHNITNTHVCHHLFPQLPHYNALEATEHLKKKLGKFYREDPRSLWEQIYATFDECQFVEEEDKIAMFKRDLDE
jgi:omega-6 fatty acid desaturase (delta-12 desaturase)